MYTLHVGEDFEPADFGWEPSNPVVAHQQHAQAMYELHRFGFVSAQYSRFQVPFAHPAVLTIAGYDAGSRRYRLFYMPPFECPGRKVTRDVLLREIRDGVGWAEDSPGQPFVSPPEK